MSDNGTPKHWARVALSQVAEVRLGRQRSPKRAVGDHMRPYMRAANVTWQGIDTTDVKEMDFTPKEFETYELRSGDILLAEASGSASEVGKPAIWRDQVPGACFQNTLIRVRAPGDVVPFLHLHFVKDALTGAFASASRGVGIHHLGAAAMSEWPITLPPPSEQHRIVAAIESYFSRLDAATATLERVRRNLERYRASVLKSAVEGRLVPTEAELAKKEGRSYELASVLLKRILAERRRRWEQAELAKLTAKGKKPTDDKWKAQYKEPAAPNVDALPELPEGWCWASLDQFILSIEQGWSPRCESEPSPSDDAWAVMKTTAIQPMQFDGSQNKTLPTARKPRRSLELHQGDILVTRKGPRYRVGVCCVVRHTRPRVMLCDTVYRLIHANEAQADFLELALNAPEVVTELNRRKAGISDSGVNLAQQKLLSMPIPLPPAAEQRRIREQVDRKWSVARLVEGLASTDARRCVRARQAILKWAFEGRLVDQDASKTASFLSPADEAATSLASHSRVATP